MLFSLPSSEIDVKQFEIGPTEFVPPSFHMLGPDNMVSFIDKNMVAPDYWLVSSVLTAVSGKPTAGPKLVLSRGPGLVSLDSALPSISGSAPGEVSEISNGLWMVHSRHFTEVSREYATKTINSLLGLA